MLPASFSILLGPFSVFFPLFQNRLNLGVADQIGRCRDFDPFLRRGQHLLFVCVSAGKQQTLEQRAANLALQFADRPVGINRFLFVNVWGNETLPHRLIHPETILFPRSEKSDSNRISSGKSFFRRNIII